MCFEKSCCNFGNYEFVNKIKNHCKQCRYLREKVIDVEIRTIPKRNITVTSAFYGAQTNTWCPFKVCLAHHKKRIIKVLVHVYIHNNDQGYV